VIPAAESASTYWKNGWLVGTSGNVATAGGVVIYELLRKYRALTAPG
jgi:hypothetical protein